MWREDLRRDLECSIPTAASAHGFSGSVLVSVGRSPIFQAAYGTADRIRNTPNEPATRFGTASGTKLFTALTAGTLMDEGRLSLESRLSDTVVTPLPGISSEVTIRHLLTHTSGVYDYYDEELIDDFDTFELEVSPSRLLRPADYLPMITGRPMKFEPGARFSYSNSGYVLLGLVIEELTAGTYHEAVVERVFEPAGMRDSGFYRFDHLPERVAQGYVETNTGWKTNAELLPIIGGPDGGAFSTVGDIDRVWMSLTNGDLLSPELTGIFRTPAAESRPGLSYGCGLWILEKGDSLPVLQIEGCDAGVSLRSTRYGNRIVATVMSNTSGGAWPMHRVIDALVHGSFSFEREPTHDLESRDP